MNEDKKEEQKTPSEVITTIKNILITKRDLNWHYPHIKNKLLNQYLPDYLNGKRNHIINQINGIYRDFLAEEKDISYNKFCILINGPSQYGKTQLANKLMISLLQEKKVIKDNKAAFWEEIPLNDKLPRLNGAEVVILDDFDGKNRLGTLNKLIGVNNQSEIRVLGDYEYTIYLKGVIIPTMDNIERWVNGKTDTLRRFWQLINRMHGTLYLFERVKKITWEEYQGKLYYVGNIRVWIYDTICKYLPHLQDKLLFFKGRRTKLADDLGRLCEMVYWKLWKEKDTYDGGYYDLKKIPKKYHVFQIETELLFKEKVVKMFKLPTYDWLRGISQKLNNELLMLPKIYQEKE